MSIEPGTVQKIPGVLMKTITGAYSRTGYFKLGTLCDPGFDFIFADPPYALKELETIPSRIFEKGLLKEDGLLVLEHGKDNHFENDPHFIERRVYGSVNFSFFKAEVQTDE